MARQLARAGARAPELEKYYAELRLSLTSRSGRRVDRSPPPLGSQTCSPLCRQPFGQQQIVVGWIYRFRGFSLAQTRTVPLISSSFLLTVQFLGPLESRGNILRLP